MSETGATNEQLSAAVERLCQSVMGLHDHHACNLGWSQVEEVAPFLVDPEEAIVLRSDLAAVVEFASAWADAVEGPGTDWDASERQQVIAQRSADAANAITPDVLARLAAVLAPETING